MCQNKVISHLFYMDDLKLFAKNEKELNDQLNIVKAFSDAIKMQFNAEKCAKLTIKRGKHSSSENLSLDSETKIKELEQNATYKYLGISENAGINHNQMKDKIRKEYLRRTRLVLKSQLNSKNKIMAINSIAVPVLTYSFPIVNWKLSEIRRIDAKTRKLFTMHRAHHPKADVERLYLKRWQGGRGLLQLELELKMSFIGMDKYLKITTDWMLQSVKAHEEKKKLYSITRQATEYKNSINYKTTASDNKGAAAQAKHEKKIAKRAALDNLLKCCKNKPLHGQFQKRVSEQDIDPVKTFSWLKSSTLKAETEGFVLAAQDPSLKTKNYLKNIMKTGKDSKCRYCEKN